MVFALLSNQAAFKTKGRSVVQILKCVKWGKSKGKSFGEDF